MRIETHRNHHAIHNIEWKTSWRIFAVRGAAFKNSSNNQAWSVVTRNLVQNVKAAQRKEKQQWAVEKPKLDNVRNLRGNYFVDPDEKEFKETIKHALKSETSNGSRDAL